MQQMVRFGIGSSDACLVHGKTSFGRTEFDLFMELRNGGDVINEEDHAKEQNYRMRLGNTLEPMVLARLAERISEMPGLSGVKMRPGPGLFDAPLVHKKHPFIFDRPDSVGDVGMEVLLCEAKVVTVPDRAAVVGGNEIPENYVYQGLHHIAVAQSLAPASKVRLFYGFADLVNFEEKYLEFVYDQAQVDDHVAKCAEWWQRHVVDGVAPAITGENSGKLAAELNPNKGAEREAQPDESELLGKIAQLKALSADVDASLKEAEGALRQWMLERGVDKLWSEVGSYSYGLRSGQTRLDREAFDASYPGVWEKFAKKGEPFRSPLFTAKRAKKEK